MEFFGSIWAVIQKGYFTDSNALLLIFQYESLLMLISMCVLLAVVYILFYFYITPKEQDESWSVTSLSVNTCILSTCSRQLVLRCIHTKLTRMQKWHHYCIIQPRPILSFSSIWHCSSKFYCSLLIQQLFMKWTIKILSMLQNGIDSFCDCRYHP